MPGISILIACRDEADTLWFTLQSLQMHTRGPFVERDGMEIVVADNDPGAKTCGRTVREVCAAFANARFPVRYVAAGEVKSVYFPRNQAAAAAQGEHLIFLDAHVLLTPTTIEALHRLFLSRSGLDTHALLPDLYMAHIPIVFDNPNCLLGPYKLRLHGDFWGEWTPMSELPPPRNGTGLEVATYPIAASGLWCYSTPKAALEAVRGYNPCFTGYSGGEVYLELKYWLLGGHVLLVQGQENEQETVSGVHWSAPRRYHVEWEESIRNILLAVSVVVPDCLDEVTDTLQKNSKIDSSTLAALREQGLDDGAEEAQWMLENRKYVDTAALEASWRKHGVFF
ncbi:MAG: glycosyltransferase family A protein [Thermoanaerobaculia bacterium]